MNIHRNCIYNFQTRSNPNVNQLVKGQIAAYPYNGIALAIKKKRADYCYMPKHGAD